MKLRVELSVLLKVCVYCHGDIFSASIFLNPFLILYLSTIFYLFFFFKCLSDPQIDGLGCLRFFLKYNQSLQAETVSVGLFCIRSCGFSFQKCNLTEMFFFFSLFSNKIQRPRLANTQKQCKVEYVDVSVVCCSPHSDVLHVVGVRDGKRAKEPWCISTNCKRSVTLRLQNIFGPDSFHA